MGRVNVPVVDWKRAEGNFFKWAGGKRHPSQGISFEDGEGDWWTCEAKTRSRQAHEHLPDWILGAFGQAKRNEERHPDKVPFVLLAHQDAPRKKFRYFLALEVDIKKDDPAVMHFLTAMGLRLEGLA